MINLTPIDERIQKRLFQKMELLGRANVSPNNPTDGDGLTLQNLSNKTTFIRMSSTLPKPVVLMGGELDEFRQSITGYDDIYGARSNTENKFNRPMPGVKSIDVTFQGGVKALRETTINWTCWSFEDITRLTPHFLDIGKPIIVEWGWVYDKNTLRNLPTLIDLVDKAGSIKDTVYTDYQELVKKVDGDFDFTTGIVKDFEYTTREDGAFDCQTVITSVGVSIFDEVQPTKETENTSIIAKRKTLRKITSPTASTRDLLSFDVGVTFKFFIKNFRDYLYQDIFDFNEEDMGKEEYEYTLLAGQRDIKDYIIRKPVGRESKRDVVITGGTAEYYVRKNAYIYKQMKGEKANTLKAPFWIRWGWFEDNILSKFLSLVTETDTNKKPIIEHRSIDRNNDTDRLESVRIRNHKYLETVNILKYILPGKLNVFEPKPNNANIENYQRQIKAKEVGDSQSLIVLASIVNDKDLFSPFNTDKEDEGYLRNILIPYDVIARCFGVNFDSTEFSAHSINLRESFENLFRELNSDIPFWDFELTADEKDTRITKIVDTSTTAVTLKDNENVNQEVDGGKATKSVYSNGEVTNNGVFFFPVWRNDSIVKSQNVTVGIPDSLKLTAMYGNTFEPDTTAGNPDPEFISLDTICLASLVSDNESERTGAWKNLTRPVRNTLYELFGADEESELGLDFFVGPLESKNSRDNIIQFISKNQDKLKKSYKERLKTIEDQIRGDRDPNIFKDLDNSGVGLDSSIAYPPPDFLSKEYPQSFATIYNKAEYKKLYASKFHVDGVMKQKFLDFVSDRVSVTRSGAASESDKLQILPFDLELTIDGIGGILPGNSFHSTYLPQKYQERTIFQAFEIGHKVDSSTWEVTIGGKMRTSLNKVLGKFQTKESIKDILEKILGERITEFQDIFDNNTIEGLEINTRPFSPQNFDIEVIEDDTTTVDVGDLF